MYVISVEEERNIIKATDKRKRIFAAATKLLKNKIGNFESIEDEAIRKGISDLAIELIENQLRIALDKSDNELIITSYKAHLNANTIMHNFVGMNWAAYIKALRKCTRKILLSLDGFDVASDDFRTESIYLRISCPDEYKKRIDFENLFFRSLLTTVNKFKEDKCGNNIDDFRMFTDFCIVLPQERVDQIRKVDRDRAKRQYSYYFVERLSKIPFECIFAGGCDTVAEKLKILYQLGIIGVYYSKEEAKSSGYGYHICFLFNEGIDAMEHLIDKENYDTTRAKIIFNPVFIKRLTLDINTTELIGDYDWRYIEENHSRKDIIRRS